MTTDRRREVVVSGRRGRGVGLHARCSIPEATPAAGANTGQPALLLANAGQRLAAMDEQGIDVEALSINPFWYGADRDTAAKVIEIQNEKLAEFCEKEPQRFVALATVALQHPD